MATNYESANIRCPFYKRNESRKIGCEGVEEGSQLVTEYLTKERCKKKIRENCAGNYEKCEVYRMILQKYEQN